MPFSMKPPISNSRIAIWFLALGLSVFFFLFHLHFTQRYLDNDQIVYLNNMYRSMKGNMPVFFNPHHLHYEIAGEFFSLLVKDSLSVYGLDNWIFNVRLLSILYSCLGIYFFTLFVYNITHTFTLSILGSLLLGFSNGYLHYSTKVDTPIFPVVGMILILWFLEILQRDSIIRKNHLFSRKTLSVLSILSIRPIYLLSLSAGILLGFVIFLHQAMAIGSVFAVLVFLLPDFLFPKKCDFSILRKTSSKEPIISNSELQKVRLVSSVIMGGVGLVITILGYYYTGVVRYNLPFDKPSSQTKMYYFRNFTFQKWIFFYLSEGKWGGKNANFNSEEVAYGFTSAVLSPPGRKYLYSKDVFPMFYDLQDTTAENQTKNRQRVLAYNMFAILTLFVASGVLFFIPKLWLAHKRLILFSLLSSISFYYLAGDWEPFYFEMWLMPVLFLFVFFIMVLNAISRSLIKCLFFPLVTSSFVFVGFMLYHNFLNYLYPFTRDYQVHGIPFWSRPTYWKIYRNEEVYKHPDYPYKFIYKE